MSRILKLKNELLAKTDRSIQKKTRIRNGRAHGLEIALFEWVCDKSVGRINVNGPMIKAKGEWLLSAANAELPPERQISLRFSDGWLNKFKPRWGLRSFRIHGESGDADTGAIEVDLPPIHAKLKDYEDEDIFNADECGLFYKMAPCSTISTQEQENSNCMMYR